MIKKMKIGEYNTKAKKNRREKHRTEIEKLFLFRR
jgi:hypothetical protein